MSNNDKYNRKKRRSEKERNLAWNKTLGDDEAIIGIKPIQKQKKDKRIAILSGLRAASYAIIASLLLCNVAMAKGGGNTHSGNRTHAPRAAHHAGSGTAYHGFTSSMKGK